MYFSYANMLALKTTAEINHDWISYSRVQNEFGREITCVDMESSNYDKTNPDWFKQYAQDIIAVKEVE